MSPNVLCLSTAFSPKPLSRLETRERGATPKIDDPVAILLNVDSALFRDATSGGIVPVTLGSKDIPVVFKLVDLDEPRTFAKPV